MIFASANPLTKQILEGNASEETINMVLERVAPLSFFETLEIAVFLSEDEKFSKKALSLIPSIPYTSLISYAERREADPKVLEFLTYLGINEGRGELIEKIIRNPNSPLSSLLLIAERGSTQDLEILISTQIKLIAFPELIEGVKRNKNLTPFLSVKLREIEEEFFLKVEKEDKKLEEEKPPIPEPEQLSEEELNPEVLPSEFIEILDPEEKKSLSKEKYSTWFRLSRMNVSQKIKVALLGDRNERSILIRDPNKIVALSVLENPKITESEIEAIAKMRNVSEEVLKKIGTVREWVKNYQIVCSLVKNPKTPIHVSLPLLGRLLPKDLRDLSISKDLPDVVKKTAKKLLDEKK
jgi:hypothetical protein